MWLFSKKNKYDINPEENIPLQVYGTPDSMRDSKYDINPEKNIPLQVYGTPDSMRDSKYDINPEENIPQKVYGIFNITQKTSEERIKISIKNDNKDYVLLLSHVSHPETYSLSFADVNILEGKSILDLSTNISEKYYSTFISRLYSIINDWKDDYWGKGNIKWSIKIDIEDNKRLISGNGDFPSNWNEFIDLISEYEKLFKKIKNR